MGQNTSESLAKIIDLKNDLAKNLQKMGVDANESEGLETLVPKVLLSVESVKDSYFGVFEPTENVRQMAVNDLGFTPKCFVVFDPLIFAPDFDDSDHSTRMISFFAYNANLVDLNNLASVAGCYGTRRYNEEIDGFSFVSGTLSGAVFNSDSKDVITMQEDVVSLNTNLLANWFIGGRKYYYLVHG